MNDQLIREIAEQILREQLLQNWRLYALLSAIGLLSTLVGNWLSPYFRKRAETFATKADLQEVLNQVRATTHATEQVRVAISHADWVSKEWKTTRRQKLEELMNTVYSLEQWLDRQRSIWMFQAENQHEPSPVDKINVLATLYFPELQPELNAVVRAHREALLEIIQSGQKARAAGLNQEALNAAHTEAITKWQPLFQATRTAIAALDQKAPAVMREIAGA
ncbi:hypothetical protein [Ramlibacter sp. 2FC]|uniref:hypothetical protein n=1 Tax=Ramlibacter sp. 2FC TaxID=2502188 RepID=UPI0010F47864|nr:hypothetical protein [Ramlibacter sp. 2FC]